MVLFLGGIHGSEPASRILLEVLAARLQDRPDLIKSHRIVLIPSANPDGLARKRRTNANGVDINRNFPAENRRNSKRFGVRPLSEPEAVAISLAIRKYRPARIISVHQPFGVIDYDGPAETLAMAMAEHCDLPVKRLGARPGSLGPHAGLLLDIPIITLELRKHDHELSNEQLWDRYGAALLAAIRFSQ